jgi:hypothetical protein
VPRAAPGPVQAPTPNRTDLSQPQPPPGIAPQGQPNGIPTQAKPPAQPITVPTGLPYGEHQQLQAAQQAQPLPQAPGPPTMSDAMGAARQMQMPAPGSMSVTRPTERPNEPVTAGLPGSPIGAAQPAQRQVGNLSSMISAVAQAAGSPALSQLAARAAALGQ